jgi:hypothetical protein
LATTDPSGERKKRNNWRELRISNEAVKAMILDQKEAYTRVIN